MSIEIRPARVPDDIETVRQMFIEYQEWLQVDLGCHNEYFANCTRHFFTSRSRLSNSWCRPSFLDQHCFVSVVFHSGRGSCHLAGAQKG